MVQSEKKKNFPLISPHYTPIMPKKWGNRPSTDREPNPDLFWPKPHLFFFSPLKKPRSAVFEMSYLGQFWCNLNFDPGNRNLSTGFTNAKICLSIRAKSCRGPPTPTGAWYSYSIIIERERERERESERSTAERYTPSAPSGDRRGSPLRGSRSPLRGFAASRLRRFAARRFAARRFAASKGQKTLQKGSKPTFLHFFALFCTFFHFFQKTLFFTFSLFFHFFSLIFLDFDAQGRFWRPPKWPKTAKNGFWLL